MIFYLGANTNQIIDETAYELTSLKKTSKQKKPKQDKKLIKEHEQQNFTTAKSITTYHLDSSGQGPVSQKSRNFSALFRVPQFLFYLRNAEVLSHQTLQSS